MIPLEELKVYKVAMEIGDLVWDIVEKWPTFAKDTLGKQFVRCADSIALNIAEDMEDIFIRKIRIFVFTAEARLRKQAQLLKKQAREIS